MQLLPSYGEILTLNREIPLLTLLCNLVDMQHAYTVSVQYIACFGGDTHKAVINALIQNS